VCPIKALLNNLLPRLERYLGFVGRTVGLWHGDVSETQRRKLCETLPDLLLTTPESIEAILISRRTEPKAFFSDVHAVIIDELHAFAGDDRGWHLLMLLERLSRLIITEHTIQRVGLSATIKNAADLLRWLARDMPPGQKLIGAAGAPSIDAGAPVGKDTAMADIELWNINERTTPIELQRKAQEFIAGLRAHPAGTWPDYGGIAHSFLATTKLSPVARNTFIFELGSAFGGVSAFRDVEADSALRLAGIDDEWFQVASAADLARRGWPQHRFQECRP
jgi:ATP-dependent Lhr-like helicase